MPTKSTISIDSYQTPMTSTILTEASRRQWHRRHWLTATRRQRYQRHWLTATRRQWHQRHWLTACRRKWHQRYWLTATRPQWHHWPWQPATRRQWHWWRMTLTDSNHSCFTHVWTSPSESLRRYWPIVSSYAPCQIFLGSLATPTGSYQSLLARMWDVAPAWIHTRTSALIFFAHTSVKIRPQNQYFWHSLCQMRIRTLNCCM